MSFYKDVPLVQANGDTYYPRTTEESVWGADGERLDNKLNAYKNSIQNMEILQTAGGTSTAITLTGVKLENGFTITFIVKTNNNGNPTTINGKYLYKHGTTTSPKLVAGKAVTVWYNGTHFFIKASATGDAVAENVLAGKKFSNDDDTDVEGTMPNNGAVSKILPINGSYAIPAGYHNGNGIVSQNIPTKAAQTYTPGTTNQFINAGQYLTGAQTIEGDPNLNTDNIKAGKTIFGIPGKSSVVDTDDADITANDVRIGKSGYAKGQKFNGTLVPGKKYATGTATVTYFMGPINVTVYHWSSGSFGVSGTTLTGGGSPLQGTITNIGFVPSIVHAWIIHPASETSEYHILIMANNLAYLCACGGHYTPGTFSGWQASQGGGQLWNPNGNNTLIDPNTGNVFVQFPSHGHSENRTVYWEAWE